MPAPKGNNYAKGSKTNGRPEKYNKKYIKKVDEYLEQCQDEDKQLVKQINEEKGYVMYENKLIVDLPTIEGFATFIGVSEQTLYNWGKKHEDFLGSLGKIKAEQKKRLVNMGLAGEYNATIAKLMLSSNHGMAERHEHDIDDRASQRRQLSPQQKQVFDKITDEVLKAEGLKGLHGN